MLVYPRCPSNVALMSGHFLPYLGWFSFEIVMTRLNLLSQYDFVTTLSRAR